MKWVRFQAGRKAAYGIVEGEDVLEVQGTPFGRYRRTNVRHFLPAVKLLPPVIPSNFYAAGLNYRSHVEWANKTLGTNSKVPTRAEPGYRSNNALIGPDETIIIPKDATNAVHYENELVVVIGKEARHLSERDALSCVLGYTIGNDVSERTWQHEDRGLWRAKNADTFKPVGPWIDTDLDVSKCWNVTRVNGKEASRFKTDTWVFGITEFISVISKYMTLHPGDMLWMGTDAATIPALKDGDVVECEITGLGVLRNPVGRER